MNDDHEKHQLAREAKAIVAIAFRNGPIEDVHAGKLCPTCEGQIGYSRITQAEMKGIMKNAVDRVYTLLCLKSKDPKQYEIQMSFGDLYTTRWDEPHWSEGVLTSALARSDPGLLTKSDPPKRPIWPRASARPGLPSRSRRPARGWDTKTLRAFGADETASFIACPRARPVLRVGHSIGAQVGHFSRAPRVLITDPRLPGAFLFKTLRPERNKTGDRTTERGSPA